MQKAFTLTEVAIHTDISGNNSQTAFTLAEVLITLGIIGVVAAMTLPALIGKCDTYIRFQQFKKGYSILQTALQKAEFDMGGYVQCNYGKDRGSGGCPELYDKLAKNLKLIKYCENDALVNGCLPPKSYKGGEKVYAENNPNKENAEDFYVANCGGFGANSFEQKVPAYVLKDGLIFFPYLAGGGKKAYAPLLAVDINGHKDPNRWGYDLFVFIINRDTPKSVLKLAPLPSGSCHPIEKGGKSAYSFWVSGNRGNFKL